MSRGVVAWPDAATASAVSAIWEALSTAGLPSLATHTHRRHRPHVSLVVADDLEPAQVLRAIGPLPQRPITFDAPALGVFPPTDYSGGGLVLFLAVTPTASLLAEHRRVHAAAAPLMRGPWPFFGPDAWMPHLTLAFGIRPEQLDRAVAIVTARLPLAGTLASAGVEDGDSGERWTVQPLVQ